MAFYLKNAHVLDVEKGTFFSADVKIENKKIVSLDEKAPDGAERGRLYRQISDSWASWDAHVHLVWDGTSPDPMGDTIKDGNYVCFAKGVRGAMDSLKAGVTTVRDVGSHDDAPFRWQARSTVELSRAPIFSLPEAPSRVPTDTAR